MLIKKIIYILFFVLILTSMPSITYAADISAASAVVINAETKEIIFEKNAFENRSMASVTKMMTSIIAIESGRMNEKVNVSSNAIAEGSSIGLKAGDIITLESLVYGMMLESGNDAANACALHLGGSYENFALTMNDKAYSVGMYDTNFVTPSGLDDKQHYSTAYDMALLGAYCIKNPLFREICSTREKTVSFISPEYTVTFSNHNRLLDTCEGVFGIKTGFTKKSGRCLVSACKRDGVTLVCATLNAGDDWNDHQKLYDSTFSELNRSTLKFSSLTHVSVYGSDRAKAEIYCDEFVYHFKNDDEPTVQVVIPQIIYAPIEKGEIIGKVNYYSGENLIHTSYIFSQNDISATEETYKNKTKFFDWIKNILS